MDLTLTPRPLQGEISIIPSKSQAHRLLICAAFADRPTALHCPETSRDMDATAACLTALGAQINRTAGGWEITPAAQIPGKALLPCGESGSTLRFLLPIAGALGVDATFLLEGRLPQRPLSPLWEEMERMGCTLSRPDENTVRCTGKLIPGSYTMDGSVSSQFITGLLLALSLLPEESRLTVTGRCESRPYIALTRQALTLFGADPTCPGKFPLRSPGALTVEGDWSNAAFFLAANAMGSRLHVTGLDPDSVQGDRSVVSILQILSRENAAISARDIPDLIPILAVFAAVNHGAVFTDTRRLRLKESDRIASTAAMLSALGGQTVIEDNRLTVLPTGLTGGTVDAVNDHRIAMAAAMAATVCTRSVTVLGAECTEKSYPRFWEEYRRLGGIL